MKRIMEYAGETYSFEEFVRNDKRDNAELGRAAVTRDRVPLRSAGSSHFPPRIHQGKPGVLK